MTLSVGLGPLIVLAASFVNRNAIWRIDRFDWACGALSVAGTVVWLATRQGMVAIVAAIAADALAGVPTLLKAWRAPETESASAYLGSMANAVITLLTVTVVTTAVVAFPIYIAAITAVQVVLVAGRIGPRLRALTHRSPGPEVPSVQGRGEPLLDRAAGEAS